MPETTPGASRAHRIRKRRSSGKATPADLAWLAEYEAAHPRHHWTSATRPPLAPEASEASRSAPPPAPEASRAPAELPPLALDGALDRMAAGGELTSAERSALAVLLAQVNAAAWTAAMGVVQAAGSATWIPVELVARAIEPATIRVLERHLPSGPIPEEAEAALAFGPTVAAVVAASRLKAAERKPSAAAAPAPSASSTRPPSSAAAPEAPASSSSPPPPAPEAPAGWF